MTPGQSIVLWVHSVSGMDAVLLPAAMLKLCGMLFAAKAALLSIRIILLLVLRFAPVWKTGSDFLKRFVEMILLMHLAALISILQLRGEPHAYLLVWFSILSPLSWSVIAFHAAGRLIASIDGKKRMVLEISGLLILGFMAFLNTSSIWKDRPGPAWDPLRYGDVSLARMADSLEGSLSSDSASSYVLVPQEHDLWPVMTGLLNRLDKRGISVYVPSEYSFMTGMVPPGPATGLVIRPSRPAGSVSFSSSDGYVLAANDSCQVIFAEGTLD